MKLCHDFEAARSNLMNHHHVPTLDTCLGELLHEEQRIFTQTTMEHWDSVSAPVYVAQGRNKGRDMRAIQCYNCKGFGHISRDCPKKYCNYCKKQGHHISVCPVQPEKKYTATYHTSTSASSFTTLPTTSHVVPTPTSVPTLTPEMVQQMITSAFSAFGLSGSGVREDDREGA